MIELLAYDDQAQVLRAKMETWIENGAQLAWMIDPFGRTVTIYRPDSTPKKLAQPDEVHGEGPIAGFVLKTEKLWAAA